MDHIAEGAAFIAVQFGRGDGTFGSAVTTARSGGQTFSGAFQDANGDGRPDLIVHNTFTGVTYMYSIAEDGRAALLGTAAGTGASSQWGGVGDFDGNGTVDILSQTAGATILQSGNGVYSSNIERLNLTNRTDARSALTYLESMLNALATEQGGLGSSQSRLLTALNTLANQNVELASAEARIVDVDVASESAKLVRHQISQQLAAGILAQANQAQGLVLDLLKSSTQTK